MSIEPEPHLASSASSSASWRAGRVLLTLDPRGFVRAIPDPLAEVTLDDAHKCIEGVSNLSSKRVPVMVNMTKLKSMTREAREYFGGADAAQACSAVAIIVGGPVSRMLGTFFLRANVRDLPHRLFTDEVTALEWLLESRE